MRRKRTAVLSVICGALCAVCVFAYMQSLHTEAESQRAEALSRYGGEQVEVCVARRDIVAGEKVDAQAVETKMWVADLLPDNSVRSSEDVIGKTATSTILSGEVVSLNRFGETSFALDVPEGSAALSVPAKTVQAVGGALAPGTRADLYASGDVETTAIARSVLILATSASSLDKNAAGDTTWVTVAVPPESVQEIIASSHKTELYFALPASGSGPEGSAS